MAELIPRNDLQALATERLIEQYADSPKLKALIALYVTECEVLQDAAWTIIDGYDLETAIGVALDALGREVGLPRIFLDADLFGYFGYIGAPSPESYGDSAMPELGGIYSSSFNPLSGSVPMEDDQYRLHIKAKIVRNRASGTAEDMLEIIRLVIPSPGSATTINQTAKANATVSIGRALSSVEKILFTLTDLNGNGDTLLPTPAGVDLDYEDTVGPF